MSSSRTPDKWIVPGGGLEPDEGSLEAAEREVMEEAGIRGTFSRSLGQFEVNESRLGYLVELTLPIRTSKGNIGLQSLF